MSNKKGERSTRSKAKTILLLVISRGSFPLGYAWVPYSWDTQRPSFLTVATSILSTKILSQQTGNQHVLALLSSRRRDSENHEDENCLEELENEEDPEKKKKIRMEIVRSLQNSFYLSPDVVMTSDIEPTMDNGGVLRNIPLWRVQWTELPGRTNVLSVHEPMYTHMFEEIIRRDKSSRFFGHLYLPSGTRNLRSHDPQHKLKTWKDHIALPTTQDCSAVLGTLMKITDFRRMEDGKLLLLVQAIERFVVTDIVQEVPYGVAHIQLLPDREEIQLSSTTTSRKNQRQSDEDIMTTRADGSSTDDDNNLLYTEATVRPARAAALLDSWRQWYPYEYESTLLPLPAVENMEACEVLGSALAKVLPYAPFDMANLPTDGMVPPNMQKSQPAKSNASNSSQSLIESFADVALPAEVTRKPLEVCLLENNILKEAGVPNSLLKLSMGELEINLWLVLNDFLVSSRTPVSPVLLGLLPVGQSWPPEFILERVADAIDQNAATLEHKYVRVSPLYPAIRRQKRLSYYAAQLLERDPDNVHALRQLLLQIPRYARYIEIYDTFSRGIFILLTLFLKLEAQTCIYTMEIRNRQWRLSVNDEFFILKMPP